MAKLLGPRTSKTPAKMQNRALLCAKSSHSRNEFQISHPKCMKNAALGMSARTGTLKTGREVTPMAAVAARSVEATSGVRSRHPSVGGGEPLLERGGQNSEAMT